jgi:hypothetical protein
VFSISVCYFLLRKELEPVALVITNFMDANIQASLASFCIRFLFVRLLTTAHSVYLMSTMIPHLFESYLMVY